MEVGHSWESQQYQEPLVVLDITDGCLPDLLSLGASANVLCLDPAPQTKH